MRSLTGGKSKPRPSCSTSYQAPPRPRIGPAAGDDVEGRDDLGQQPGVAVGDPGDERPELHPAGAGGQGAEQRVRLEHRLIGTTSGGSWKKWSITHTESKPVSSAAVAYSTTRRPAGVRNLVGEVGDLHPKRMPEP